MYLDDLRAIFNIIDHNLDTGIKLGFHSHNNLQMSNALTQEFVNLAQNRRDIVLDATLLGMGRGAGNTPLELVMQYLNTFKDGEYDIDKILDTIDSYVTNIKSHFAWGYDIPMFLSGALSAHVNNIGYLEQKGSLRFQDLRLILNKLTSEERKIYDYPKLEKKYLEYVNKKIGFAENLNKLQKLLSGNTV
jgi:4-hydroxy 2-oxovalerate aldolase